VSKLRDYAPWLLPLILAGYVGLYFGCSRTFRLGLGGPAKTYRVFEHRFALWVFAPLLKIEQMTRSEDFAASVPKTSN